MARLDRERGFGFLTSSDGREIYLTFQVHNEAIVVPETVDCIRALTGIEPDAAASIAKTDTSLGITNTFLPATTKPVERVTGDDTARSGIECG